MAFVPRLLLPQPRHGRLVPVGHQPRRRLRIRRLRVAVSRRRRPFGRPRLLQQGPVCDGASWFQLQVFLDLSVQQNFVSAITASVNLKRSYGRALKGPPRHLHYGTAQDLQFHHRGRLDHAGIVHLTTFKIEGQT